MYSRFKYASMIDAKSGGAANAASRVAKRVMHKNEALLILNIEEPTLSKKILEDTYKRQFEKNDPKVGGSFYLQSKLFRAHETLDKALQNKEKGIGDNDPADAAKSGQADGAGASPGTAGGSASNKE
jgi:import inner membrane translocase subunit TIM16